MTAKVAKSGCRIYEVGISYSGRTYSEGKKIGWRGRRPRALVYFSVQRFPLIVVGRRLSVVGCQFRPKASRISRIVSGVVRQQPPIRRAPSSRHSLA